MIQKLYRDLTPAARTTRLAISQVVSQRCIAALLRHIATQTVAPSHDTSFCIATHPWPGHSRVRAHSPLRAGRPCRGLCWPCCGAVSQGLLVVSWLPVAHPSALYHDTICYMVAQCKLKMGSSPTNFPCTCLFFFFFTHFFLATGRLQKYIIFFFIFQ